MRQCCRGRVCSQPHTYEIGKQRHTDTGELRDHSLVCPWATVALPGSSIAHVYTDGPSRDRLTLSDEGHEVVFRAVYEFFGAHNDYDY